MYVQNVPVYTGTTRTYVSTCARGAGTHGDVLNVQTVGRFERATPRRTHTHTTTTTTDTPQTPYGDRDSLAVFPRLSSTTLTWAQKIVTHVSVHTLTFHETHYPLSSPGNPNTIQYLIPGRTTNVELLKQVENWQSPSRDPW